MKLNSIIKEFLVKGMPFVSYRLPGTSQPVTCFGGTIVKKKPAPKKNYFVFAPFDTNGVHPTLYFRYTHTFTGFETGKQHELNLPNQNIISGNNNKPIEVSEAGYYAQANKIIGLIKKGMVEKVVLSRIIARKFNQKDKAAATFEALCKIYPQAFVYFFSDGEKNQWMGASPETLLKVESGNCETMSLAGTLPLEKLNEKFIWTEKEYKEQRIVSDFIREQLFNCRVENVQELGPTTIAAGNMAHLCTQFNFQLSDSVKTSEIIHKLHPTPAVCGWPAKQAMELIRQTELHDRSYYCGYLGNVESNGNMQLFVNLRCLQLTENEAYVYVGGGLTAESEVEKEWNETLLKSETLGAVISNIS